LFRCYSARLSTYLGNEKLTESLDEPIRECSE
jgi:hypothetical protein